MGAGRGPAAGCKLGGASNPRASVGHPGGHAVAEAWRGRKGQVGAGEGVRVVPSASPPHNPGKAAYLMRSWRLTAEMSGGRWKSAPVSVSMARDTLTAPPSTAEWNLLAHAEGRGWVL